LIHVRPRTGQRVHPPLLRKNQRWACPHRHDQIFGSGGYRCGAWVAFLHVVETGLSLLDLSGKAASRIQQARATEL